MSEKVYKIILATLKLVLFFKIWIGDGYYHRPQQRYSIASVKITIEFVYRGPQSDIILPG